MEEQNSLKYKEETRAHFEKISSHYSDTSAGIYTAPMHDALLQELDGITFATILDVELVHSCQWFLINLILKYLASIYHPE
jgi:hypothetical protein